MTGPLAPLFAQANEALERIEWLVPGARPFVSPASEIRNVLASIEQRVQDMDCETRCEKCGTDDVLVRWHEKRPSNRQAACRDSMSVLDYGKRPELKKEHLHFHCRRCQFDWTGPVLAALSPVSPAPQKEGEA